MTQNAARYREFKMPDVGEGLTEAEILKWYVQPGDTVTDGQVVCEVETAKAAVELPIPYDGVVRELHFEEGATVDVGTSIITVDVAPGSRRAPRAEAPAAEPRAAAPPPRRRRPRAASPSWSATGSPRPPPSAARARGLRSPSRPRPRRCAPCRPS